MEKNIIKEIMDVVLFSTSEVCKVFGVNRCTIDEHIKKGELSGVRIGRSLKFSKEDLARFIKLKSTLNNIQKFQPKQSKKVLNNKPKLPQNDFAIDKELDEILGT